MDYKLINKLSSNGVSLNISLICKRLVNFFKFSLKMKWLDFVIGLNFGFVLSNGSCDLDNVYDDKLMIFGDKIFFRKVDDGSA